MTARMLLVAALWLGFAPPARAAEAPADTTLDPFMRSMRDSTDRYFGIVAQHPDTTGLDSVLAYGLAHPKAKTGEQRGLRLAFGPNLGFNRALGGALGAEVEAGRPSRFGRLGAEAQYANGPDVWFGGGWLHKRWADPGSDDGGWEMSVEGGRDWRAFDREHYDSWQSSLNAFIWGADRQDYLRTDGWRTSLARIGERGWVRGGWRDELESPLATTATWDLLHRPLSVNANVPAQLGRAREVFVGGGTKLSWIRDFPLRIEAEHWTSGAATGSDFTYRRTRFAAGGDLALTQHFAFAPQVEYGHLSGEAVPQEAFLLGGTSTLRTLDRDALRGTGEFFARADLMLMDDVLDVLHVPHPASFPVQVGAFGAIGGVWGRDSLSGAPVASERWTVRANECLSEAGFSLLYRPGIPLPDMFVRIDYAIPVGPADSRTARWELSFQRTLNLITRK